MFSMGSAIAISVVLGAFHLTLGWLLGQFWPVLRRTTANPAQPDTRELRQAARLLVEQVASVKRDVTEHQGRMQQLHQELVRARSKNEGPLTPSVLASVAEIVRINAHLQEQLLGAEKRLQEQDVQIRSWMAEARTDSLTGLPNRRAFDDALDVRIAEWQRSHIPFSVLAIDVDHFKRINDQHGHAVGDSVLQRVAEVLEGTLRRMDLIGRIGGEEFAVVLPNTPNVDACQAAEHCRLAIAAEEFRHGDLQLRLTVSLGVACSDTHDSAVALLGRADQAMYAAKQAGRNCVFLHDGSVCKPVNADALPETISSIQSESTPKTRQRDVPEDKDFVAVGNLLRDRLAVIVDEPAMNAGL